MNPESSDLELALVAVTGIAWTIVYIDIIWVGFRQRTFAMPAVALGLNITWELIYSAIDTKTAVDNPTSNNVSWALVEVVWAIFDVVIVYTFLRFGQAEFPDLTKRALYVWAVVIFVASGLVQMLFIDEFGSTVAVQYSAFLQTIVMSSLFIAMFYGRRGLRGQNLTIAIGKWIGTAAATIVYGVVQPSRFIFGMGVVCFVLDVIYIGLIISAKRRPASVGSANEPAGAEPGADEPARAAA